MVNAHHADTGTVYIFGILVAIPTVIITGWVLPRFLGNLDYPVPAMLRAEHEVPVEERPSFPISIPVPLVPAIIMIAATIANVSSPRTPRRTDG